MSSYRLSLVEGKYSAVVHQRGELWMKLVLKNDGFSSPVSDW